MKSRFQYAAIVALMLTSAVMADDSKFSGDVHFSYNFKDADENAFAVNRSYLTFEKKVSDALSYKFQTDIGSGGPTDFSVYLKNAKLDWKTGAGKFTFGLQGMNMFKVQENNWGYRFIEKSPMDKKKYSHSADLGVGWSKGFGNISTGVLLTNGAGYKKQENDGYKKLSVNLLFGEAKLKNGLNAGCAVSFEGMDYATSDTTTEAGNTSVLAAFAAWSQGAIKVGGEYALMTESEETSTSHNLVSLYADYTLGSTMSVFGRYDVYSSEIHSDGYAIFGLNYHPEKAFYIAPNVKIDFPDGGDSVSTYNVNFRFKI